jgi:SAM-dependent methyltransferase
MIWPWAAIRERDRAVERVDSHDVTDADLSRLFDFTDNVARYLGGHSIVLRFLAAASRRWVGPVTVLDLGCGRGSLARAIIEWAHIRGLDVKVHGTDKYGRIVHLARERHHGIGDLTFETRDLNDAFFLQAQQFDYVVSAQALHRENDARLVPFLKTANRQAKRGVIVVDWLRDARAAFYLSTLARFSRDPMVCDEARLAVRRGFTLREADRLRQDAGLDYARVGVHFGYRFSIEGERGLVTEPLLSPNVGLATG